MICYEGVWRNYPETFRDEEKMDADSESNEGEIRPEKKAEIRERLLCKRTAERFMGYESLMDDPNLTTKEKIIHLQRVTDDVTRRKIHFASLQGQFLQSCFDRSMKVYDETLKEVKIKKWWALYLRTALYLFVLFAIT